MPFSPLRSMPATLVAFMMMCATPASSSTGPDLSPYPCTDDDPDRGGGLPHCECDAYHNGAFQCMSRMCSKPWEDMNVCYPTRVGHPGTVLEGRFFNNYCDDGQSMCSPWTPPASSFPVYVAADLRSEVSFIPLAARGCAMAVFLPDGQQWNPPIFSNSDGGCASCDGLPILGYKLSDYLCSGSFDDPSVDNTGNYVSNSYVPLPDDFSGVDGSFEDSCTCLWCPTDPPSGFDVGNYNYDAVFDLDDFVDGDFDLDDFCRSLSTRI